MTFKEYYGERAPHGKESGGTFHVPQEQSLGSYIIEIFCYISLVDFSVSRRQAANRGYINRAKSLIMSHMTSVRSRLTEIPVSAKAGYKLEPRQH